MTRKHEKSTVSFPSVRKRRLMPEKLVTSGGQKRTDGKLPKRLLAHHHRRGVVIEHNVLRFGKRGSEGNPVRSMRWHPNIWLSLGELEVQHHYKVKVNRIASVAVEWGVAFLGTLSPKLQERVLGVKGARPLTFKESEALREELNSKLGSLAGKFKLDDRMVFALPKPAKDLLRQEAEKADTTMSAIARQRIIINEVT
jgi:hypothetical protein